jgi:SpoVK/Ycf46/Vps4 family AAA+-type ATPase
MSDNKEPPLKIVIKKRPLPDDLDDSSDEDKNDNNINNINENNNKENNKEKIMPLQKRKKYYCLNNNCDHKKKSVKWYDSNKVDIKEINNLEDLIKLSSYYHCRMRRFYNGIDLKLVLNLKDSLIELNEMIGLQNIKNDVLNMIIYLLTKCSNDKRYCQDMLHVVVTGVPGSGKTTFVDVLAKIYGKLNVLNHRKWTNVYDHENSNGSSYHIVKVKRSDLIGKYLGHTAVQTQKKIDEAYGGILLIDEAYSLGNPEGRDSFSKECLDTLNQALTEDKGNFICIIAGYKDALESSFFSYNAGLKRRFPFRFDIEKYTYSELSKILLKKLNDKNSWFIELFFKNDELDILIKEHYEKFECQGGDMETIYLNIKISHNKRVFLLPLEEKHKLFITDVKMAINNFLLLKDIKKVNTSLYGYYI